PRVERYIKKRRADGVKSDTIEAELSSLRAFARWAIGSGNAPRDVPLLSVPKLHSTGKLAGKNWRPPRAREMGEVLREIAMVRAAREDIGLFLEGIALFGLRPAAVASLRRGDARPPRLGDSGRLFCKGFKGEPDRYLGAPENSLRAAWLRDCLALGRRYGRTGKGAPLVPCRSNRSALNPGGWTTATLDNAVARLARRLKIGLQPYDIRHTCGAWLKRQQSGTQHYLGHTRVETQNVYDGIFGNEAEPAFVAVENAIRGRR
ncbi:MAG: hypothetical protein LUG50_08290, partial [Planctomycetaceae bacterium]|nr:hypothetical protein [Planctomycetaceae bacterium]